MRAYLDNLSKENKQLQETHAAMEITARDAMAARNYMEQHRNQLESALHTAKDQVTSHVVRPFAIVKLLHLSYLRLFQYAKELDARTKEWHALENGYHNQLSEKDSEIRHLLLQVDLASQSNVEEVTATRQLIQESMKEMEAHKAKRLAARSEMINLAKVRNYSWMPPLDFIWFLTYVLFHITKQTLERAQSDGDEVKAQVQFVLTPIVSDQVSALALHFRRKLQ